MANITVPNQISKCSTASLTSSFSHTSTCQRPLRFKWHSCLLTGGNFFCLFDKNNLIIFRVTVWSSSLWQTKNAYNEKIMKWTWKQVDYPHFTSCRYSFSLHPETEIQPKLPTVSLFLTLSPTWQFQLFISRFHTNQMAVSQLSVT